MHAEQEQDSDAASTDIDESSIRLESMRKLMAHVPSDVFSAKFTTKSCNDEYITNLFSKPEMSELYRLHHEMAQRGNLYFENFKQFKERSMTDQEKERVFFYCEHYVTHI